MYETYEHQNQKLVTPKLALISLVLPHSHILQLHYLRGINMNNRLLNYLYDSWMICTYKIDILHSFFINHISLIMVFRCVLENKTPMWIILLSFFQVIKYIDIVYD